MISLASGDDDENALMYFYVLAHLPFILAIFNLL
jgi:hypothetical protein